MRFWHQSVVGIAVLALAPSVANAQDVVAGWEGEPGRGYAFVAPTIPLTGAASRQLVLRTSASFLYYELSRDGTELVRSPGASVGLGIRATRARVTFSVVPGYEIRRTARRQTTDDGDTSVVERGPTIQAEAFVRATDTTAVMLLGSYGHANRYTWVRGGVSRALARRSGATRITLRLGGDGTVQGNADLQTLQAGPLLDIGIGPSASVQVRGGYSRRLTTSPAATHSGYVAAGVYRRF